MKTINLNKLLRRAHEARELAYAPYSKYQVGAAVLSPTGKIYTGCNVENASYGLTVCAERNAIFKAVSAGEREIIALAVVTANGGSPCGACRQVMYEFMHPDAPIAVTDALLENIRQFTVGKLLPHGFSPRTLRQGQNSNHKKPRV